MNKSKVRKQRLASSKTGQSTNIEVKERKRNQEMLEKVANLLKVLSSKDQKTSKLMKYARKTPRAKSTK